MWGPQCLLRWREHSVPEFVVGPVGAFSLDSLCKVPAPTGTVSVAGASAGQRMYAGVEDPAGGHCWADGRQHLAGWVGSDDLEGMTATGMT